MKIGKSQTFLFKKTYGIDAFYDIESKFIIIIEQRSYLSPEKLRK